MARLPRRAGPPPAARRGAMVRRRLGSRGPEITPVGLGTWAMGGPWEFGWGPARRRAVRDGDPARGRERRQLGRQRRGVRGRPRRGDPRERARAVRGRRGRVRVHESVGVPGRTTARAPGSDTTCAQSRSATSASKACGGCRSTGSISTSSTGRTTGPARRSRSRGG